MSQNESKFITIKKARSMSNFSRVKVRGIVTSVDKEIFIQDETTGINLCEKIGGDNFEIGDLIEVTGIIKLRRAVKIKEYYANKISCKSNFPEIKEITIKEILDGECNNYDCCIIKIKDVKIENLNSIIPIRISDGCGNKIYLKNQIKLSNVDEGDIVEITAILYLRDRPQLFIRDFRDIIKINSPICFAFLPENLSVTFNSKPKVSMLLNQGKAYVDLYSAVVKIDNENVEIFISENSLNCIIEEALSFGEHGVELIIYDKKNNVHEFNWKFYVIDEKDKFNFYYGIPHAHTSYSDGMGTPYEAYEHARIKGLDYLIVTDHCGSLICPKCGELKKCNNSGVNVEKWEAVKKEADAIDSKYNDFVAIYGFELKTKLWHHMNVINSKNFVGKDELKRLESLSMWIKKQKNIILTANHPIDTDNVKYVEDFDGLVNLIEVANGAPPFNYLRMENYYFNALDEGWIIGASNAQDNHINNWGDVDNVTVVVAKKLDKLSIIEAFKMRRTYSSETKTLKLLFKVNDYWMGSVINLENGNKLEFEIIAEDIYYPIDKIQIISNGGKVLREKEFNKVSKAEWRGSINISDEIYNCGIYWNLVRVFQTQERQGISSPIWTRLSKTPCK